MCVWQSAYCVWLASEPQQGSVTIHHPAWPALAGWQCVAASVGVWGCMLSLSVCHHAKIKAEFFGQTKQTKVHCKSQRNYWVQRPVGIAMSINRARVRALREHSRCQAILSWSIPLPVAYSNISFWRAEITVAEIVKLTSKIIILAEVTDSQCVRGRQLQIGTMIFDVHTCTTCNDARAGIAILPVTMMNLH